MGKFLKFEKMLTPIIIHIVFWLGVFGSIIVGVFMIGYGIFSDSAGFVEIISGIFIMFIGPFVVRIYCELMMVIFKILSVLIEIRDGKSASPSPIVETREEEII